MSQKDPDHTNPFLKKRNYRKSEPNEPKNQIIEKSTRWDQIREEINEQEEKLRQENIFKQKNRDENNFYKSSERYNSQRSPASYFYSTKEKPKKKMIFDLAKESDKNGFPTLGKSKN